jgi:hypothetical protein
MSGETAPARRLKIGMYVPFSERQMDGETPRWADILAMARRAEAVGFDSLWVPDHLIQYYEGVAPRGGWECWTLVSALAAATSRVELGTIVTATSFRNPALLAKIVDTVEEISGGRVILGLGTGYHEPEYRAFGYPYDHPFSRFEEALTILHGLLRHGQIDFAGTYYQARECELRPRGPRPNGPPILIGSRRCSACSRGTPTCGTSGWSTASVAPRRSRRCASGWMRPAGRPGATRRRWGAPPPCWSTMSAPTMWRCA